MAPRKDMTQFDEAFIDEIGIKQGTNILDIDIPRELETRVLSGIPWVDDVYGASECEQGVTPSTTILLTGGPGTGKTTHCLQLADSWTENGNIALYNTNEESAFQVRKVTKRLSLKSGFYIGENRLINDVFKHADMLREQNPNKQLLLIVDSIQTHDDGFYANGTTNTMTAVRVTKAVTSYCKKTYSIGVLIGQVNKDGLFSGKNTIKHLTDVHAHMKFDQKQKSPTFGKRIYEMQKNRFGRAFCGYLLGLDGNRGLYEEGTWYPTFEE